MHHRLDPIELMGRHKNRSPGCGCIGDQRVDDVAAGLIEPGVRFIEEPQFGTARCGHSNCGATALPGGKPTHRNIEQPPFDLHTSRGSILLSTFDASGPTPESQVLFDGQIVVQHRLMTDVANPVAHRTTVGAEIASEHDCGTALGPQQSCAKAKQRRLTSAVGALEQNGLASLDLQGRTGERGEPTKKHDYLGQINDGHS